MLQLERNPLPIVEGLQSPEGKWELLEVIGEGNYGEVYKAKNVTNGDIVAIKVMEAALDKEEDIKAELNVFENHAHHPNIVDYYGAFIKKNDVVDDQLWIVMELCSSGSVTDLAKLMKEKGERLSEDVIAYILREVLAGLSYLHSSCVLHRDIKGQNVLLTTTARVKLIDFGISVGVDSPTGRRRTAIGTPYWMAPEVIACETQLEYSYDARADIWSLGITAIEIADSTPPLFGEHPMRALLKIPRHSPPTLHAPSLWSNRFNDFIRLCLTKDFEKRPTSREMLTHNFVSSVPKDPRSIRRQLVSLMSNHQLVETTPLTDSSTSTAADTLQRNIKGLKTLDTVSDLAGLEYIDESIIVSQLWKRYQKQRIYTYVGDILVSINPFQKLDIYNEKYSFLYCNAPRSHLPPHIFAIANSAYHLMVHERHDQCCVVSGESGAGKTEASNILVQQFMRLGKAETRSLEEKILKVNPLMESFGNARTIINNNSSRFGKYLELHFTSDGRVIGAHVSEYLLEKSRVVSQARRERNFHIFYYMLAGLGVRKQLDRYRLRSSHHHRYLEHRGTHKGHLRHDAIYNERFNQVEQAFHLFGFTKAEFDHILKILAAILNIGDIRLEGEMHPHIGEISVVANTDSLNDVALLLQINAESFHKIITSSQVITYGETIVKNNTPEKALDTRDAIAKTLYGRLFSWIVNRINPALNSARDSSYERCIGILDIFGFENFRKNSFEQLCINVANEQLQFYFNQHIFAWEQEEYEREGINVAQVGYCDNRLLLELLLSRPVGLFSLLDEESRFPRSTDLSLATKFHGNFEPSSYYRRPKDGGPTFTILHYAGSVTYETATFLEKNRDTLKPEVAKVLQKSANEVVRSLFSTPLSRTGSLSTPTGEGMFSHKTSTSATPLFNRRSPHGRSRPIRPHSGGPRGHTPLSSSGTTTAKLSQTVSTYFINSLRDLMSKMLLARPHFVRCIRPNDMKSPDMFQPEKVLLQLRYTGVLETTRIRKEGFSHRISFDDFVQRYQIICFPLSTSISGTVGNCTKILEKAKLVNWAIGKTKVFLKYYHSEQLLLLLSEYERCAIILQSLVRGRQARKITKNMRRERARIAAVRIQAGIRRFLVRCRYLKLLAERDRAATLIQTALRSWKCRSQYLELLQERQVAAIKIQSGVRQWLCRKRYLTKKKSIATIQRAVRCWSSRKQLRKLKEARETKWKEQERTAAVKAQKSLRWKLQQQAQASVHQMEQQLHREGSHMTSTPNHHQEILSATIIQRAYRKSVANRRRKKRVRINDIECNNKGNLEVHVMKRWKNTPHQRKERAAIVTSPKEVLASKAELIKQQNQQTPPTKQKPVQSWPPEQKNPEPKSPKPEQSPPLFPGSQSIPLHHEDRSDLYHPHIQGKSLMLETEDASSVQKSSMSTLNARRLFEELISRHAAEVKRDNAMLRGQRVKLVGHQRVKARRPKSKPDSVIQRLLERFDPLKLNSTNNSRLY